MTINRSNINLQVTRGNKMKKKFLRKKNRLSKLPTVNLRK